MVALVINFLMLVELMLVKIAEFIKYSSAVY